MKPSRHMRTFLSRANKFYTHDSCTLFDEFFFQFYVVYLYWITDDDKTINVYEGSS